MPEFKIQAKYYGSGRREIFFGEKESVTYHCFSIKESIDDIPGEYFRPSSVLRTKNEKGWKHSWDPFIYCWLFISENLAQKLKFNFEKDKSYQFVVRLGEPKAAKFIATKIGKEYEEHQLVLKSKQYFENTVQKIGFWGNDNYFYEVDKGKKPAPPKPNQPTPNQTSNQNIGVKVVLICLPFLILGLLLLLLIKWISRKKSKS
ncbi:MAG: hypothetical protein I3270_01925 [Candidatus Moeniiplasma glomeromycotorum]|nr:hypothetical protein [Candidatus Moeniiplasma glomeromycotorum]MCE8162460.1 hypothetical protein [Candidatus Moeniiplasma glomeromycotorum]MCE8166386.1 hypothetical protein [Candidatus Moeniiplasma glomeromycotorum]MCE8166868.1 hypothetical protein [Candidatus Moeniiplasma glomeromycotorum]